MTLVSTDTQQRPKAAPDPAAPDERRDWLALGIGLVGLVAVLATALAVAAIATSAGGDSGATAAAAAPASAAAVADPANAPAPTLAEAEGVDFEPFELVDPNLPAVPAGDVKRFVVDVAQHDVQVSPDLAPTEAWTYTVNGEVHRGTAASPPIVVNEGDEVVIEFVNGGSKAMDVTMPHSIDFHSAEVAPSRYYGNIEPGESIEIPFQAKHPGVFMYHCATQPILMHLGAGMAGMMVVRPKGLAPVDRELWITQGEYYIGQPGAPTDMAKAEAANPDVIAFNGYANQYKDHPIEVRKGERIRMWVLNTGPSKWSAFHVIGTVFDRAIVENTAFRDSQTINLAPSQGGYVELTLDQEGEYPFVTHAFGDMVKGAVGVLRTSGAEAAPASEGAGHDHG